MASIGPQLPPHLQKRKRGSDDGESASPPTKISRPDTNQDEIPLEDDDSDDAFGPSAPKPSIGPSMPPSRPSIGPSRPDEAERVAKPTTTQPSIGPSLPPPQPPTTSNNDEIPLDEDSDNEDIGPAAPSAPSIGPSMPPPAAPKRIYGPAPPPADLSERPTTDPNSDSDSDSDDGYGPALPGSRPAAASSNRGPSFPSFAQQQASSEQPQAPKRDDWMIAPPTDSAYRAPDPTKLKSRKFASGRAGAPEKSGGGVSSIWTETPEEKIKRLAAAVLGREDPSAANSHNTTAYSASASGSISNTRTKQLDEARVRQYTEQTRGRSLVEEHQAAIAAGRKKVSGENATSKPGRAGDQYGKRAGVDAVDDEDDPSKRAFDREKDMAVGGRISHTQRRDLLNKAANFGDRFQSGKFL